MKNYVLYIIIAIIIGLLFWYGSSMHKEDSLSASPDNLKDSPRLAIIHTSRGDISVELYPKAAPNTVSNFINKSQNGFYNNLTFHRVEDWVVQGGDPDGNGTGGGQMKTELNKLPYKTGAIGVARGQDINISNDAQFFIVKSDSSWLDNQYTNFGQVTAGMDVVNQIKIGDKIESIEIKN